MSHLPPPPAANAARSCLLLRAPTSDGLSPLAAPPLQGWPENALTPEALLHGYRHSEAWTLGFDAKRELALTLTDQPPGFYAPASLAYWRKVGCSCWGAMGCRGSPAACLSDAPMWARRAAAAFLCANLRQLTCGRPPSRLHFRLQALHRQLQGPARRLAAKRKAGVLYDAPLAGSVPAVHKQPCFPQQEPSHPGRPPAAATTTREAAEAWVRQHLAAPGAPPLRALAATAGGEAAVAAASLSRGRLFELLAELAVPLPRALWFVRVAALNRTRCVMGGGGHRRRRL